ncbi:MAG: hypothetical protein RLZZ450_7495, partial [Pseudomonadota bacterium]
MSVAKRLQACALGVGLVVISSGCEPTDTTVPVPVPAPPVGGAIQPAPAGSPTVPPPPLPQPIAGSVGFPVAGTMGTFCPSGGSVGGFAGSTKGFPPQQEAGVVTHATVVADKTPPPISGGTLLTTHDGKLLVAADPDRDQVYFIDAVTEKLLFTRQLNAGDEPGRVVEDGAGLVHVALRGAGAVATLTRVATDPIVRRAVCDLPRGMAYDAAQDALQIGCAEGKLVTLSAARSGAVTRRVDLGVDVRDVIVRGSTLLVSRFRSAELLSLGADGQVLQRTAAPTFRSSETVFAAEACGASSITEVANTPTIAWRAVDVPGQGVAMVHQRARTSEVQVTEGGYGGFTGCAPGIVHSAITIGADGANARSADIGNLTMVVDIATDPEGALLAVVAPGNWMTGMAQVELYRTQDSDYWTHVTKPGSGETLTDSGACTSSGMSLPVTDGQATAVAFSTPYVVAVQEREPAGVTFIDTRTGALRSHLDLKQPTRFDTGHALFHARAGAGLACASCHAEGGDDSHVWTFHGIGARRTQQLR